MSAIAERNKAVAFKAALLGLAMLGLAFASVPLYRLFCQVTGFGGTTQVADQAPGAVAGEIGVRFDANIEPSMPWTSLPQIPHALTRTSTSRGPIAGSETSWTSRWP